GAVALPGVEPEPRDRDRDRVVRGIAWNWLGTIGGFVTPAFFLLVNRAYGPAVFGMYALVLAPVEILQNLVASGYSDAVQRFAARDEDAGAATDVHYAILRRCLLWVAGVGAAVIALVAAVGKLAVTRAWHDPTLYGPLLLMTCNV